MKTNVAEICLSGPVDCDFIGHANRGRNSLHMFFYYVVLYLSVLNSSHVAREKVRYYCNLIDKNVFDTRFVVLYQSCIDYFRICYKLPLFQCIGNEILTDGQVFF